MKAKPIIPALLVEKEIFQERFKAQEIYILKMEINQISKKFKRIYTKCNEFDNPICFMHPESKKKMLYIHITQSLTSLGQKLAHSFFTQDQKSGSLKKITSLNLSVLMLFCWWSCRISIIIQDYASPLGELISVDTFESINLLIPGNLFL